VRIFAIFSFFFAFDIYFYYFCGFKIYIDMWKEKFGNYLIDISKYVFTGVVITSFFKDFGDSKSFIYGIGIIFSVMALITGLVLTNKRKEDK